MTNPASFAALCGTSPIPVNRPEFRAASFLVRKDAIMPKHYDAEVKARAVRLVTEHKVESGSVTKSCEAVGRRLGISKETLRGWCRQAQVDAGEREGVSSEELAEIKRLKAENRRLREDVEILRAATTFFASMRHEVPCWSRGGERPSPLGRRSGLMKLGAA